MGACERNNQRCLSLVVSMVLVSGMTMILSAQSTAQKSGSEKSTSSQEGTYRALTPADGLACGARIASMGFSFSGPPSGELNGFECLNKEG